MVTLLSQRVILYYNPNSKGEIIEQRAIVADIDAQMILGLDFIREHNSQLHLGEGTLTIGDQNLVCYIDSA